MIEVEEILNKARNIGFGDVIVIGSEMDGKQIRFDNSQISIAKHWRSMEVELWAELEKKLVATRITDLSKVEGTLEKLFQTAKRMQPKKDYYGIAGDGRHYAEIPETFDSSIVDLDDPTMYVEEAINSALEEGAERVAGALYIEHEKVYLSNSNGIRAGDEGTKIEISVRAMSDGESSGHGTNCSRTLSGFDPKLAGRKAGEIALLSRNPVEGEAGRYDVIFDPLAFGGLLEYLGIFSSIFNVESGLSFLSNKLGERVADEMVTVKDTGNIPNGYGSRKFDDEGVPTRTTTIIEDGILKSYLHWTSSARKYKTETTANAGIINPEPWNIYLNPGDYSKDELFGEVKGDGKSKSKRGIWITNIWYTRFQNYLEGGFSTIPRDGAFWIEDGEIKEPIKNIRISDNIQRILENIACLGRELYQVHGWEVETPVFTPYVLVKDVGITKATK